MLGSGSGAVAAAVLAIAVLAGCAARPVDGAEWTDAHDRTYARHSQRFFGIAFDWRWFKAQGIAESSLRPAVVSHAGAQGMMQIMPSTWAEIVAAAPLRLIDPFDAADSIAAGIFYDRRLYDLWRDIPGLRQRLAFTFASYNGGRGRMLRAQAICTASASPPIRAARCAEWQSVSAHAPGETRRYVERIMSLMGVRL